MPEETIKIKVREEGEIDWQIEERPITPSREWLWALIIVGFAVIVFSVMLNNYLLIVIVALAAFIIYASKNKTPELRYFRLDNEGLYIDGELYPYENFESFWIFPARNASLSEAGEPERKIAFRRKHHLMPLLIVPFHSPEESEIRKILESRLPENEEEESFLDLLQKRFF